MFSFFPVSYFFMFSWLLQLFDPGHHNWGSNIIIGLYGYKPKEDPQKHIRYLVNCIMWLKDPITLLYFADINWWYSYASIHSRKTENFKNIKYYKRLIDIDILSLSLWLFLEPINSNLTTWKDQNILTNVVPILFIGVEQYAYHNPQWQSS